MIVSNRHHSDVLAQCFCVFLQVYPLRTFCHPHQLLSVHHLLQCTHSYWTNPDTEQGKVKQTQISFIIFLFSFLHNLIFDGWTLSLCLSIFLLSGCLYSCSCISALLLPVLFLLGSHGGMAVLHGCDWPS